MVSTAEVKAGVFMVEVGVPTVVITGDVERTEGAVSAEVIRSVLISAEGVARVVDSAEVVPSVVSGVMPKMVLSTNVL